MPQRFRRKVLERSIFENSREAPGGPAIGDEPELGAAPEKKKRSRKLKGMQPTRTSTRLRGAGSSEAGQASDVAVAPGGSRKRSRETADSGVSEVAGVHKRVKVVAASDPGTTGTTRRLRLVTVMQNDGRVRLIRDLEYVAVPVDDSELERGVGV